MFSLYTPTDRAEYDNKSTLVAQTTNDPLLAKYPIYPPDQPALSTVQSVTHTSHIAGGNLFPTDLHYSLAGDTEDAKQAGLSDVYGERPFLGRWPVGAYFSLI